MIINFIRPCPWNYSGSWVVSGSHDGLSEQESGEAYKGWSVNYKGKQEKDNVAWQTLTLWRMSPARVLKRSYIPPIVMNATITNSKFPFPLWWIKYANITSSYFISTPYCILFPYHECYNLNTLQPPVLIRTKWSSVRVWQFDTVVKFAPSSHFPLHCWDFKILMPTGNQQVNIALTT